jgi:hypothetical protein
MADWRQIKGSDLFEPIYTPSVWGWGYFCLNVTQDDVGGLRYLLSPNNVQLETLLSDVHGTGTNAGSYMNLAMRPGVDKITFVRQQFDSNGGVIPLTNRFTDRYVSNNTVMSQTLERVVTRPDFLFSVEDFGASPGWGPVCVRTGISNWWNSASVSANTNLPGPGVIQPPVNIIFDRPGTYLISDGSTQPDFESLRWATFDGTTNPITIYPQTPAFSGANQLKIRLTVTGAAQRSSVVWQTPVSFGSQATLQTSTNLVDWVPEVTVTNNGGSVQWEYPRSLQPRQFFRAVPQ